MDSDGCVYGLDHQARCLKAQLGDQERSRFFVGTQDYKHTNELHLIDFDEDESMITSHKIPHDHEIRAIAPSPTSAELVVTVYKEASKPAKACLWRLAVPDSDSMGKLKNDVGSMEAVTYFESAATSGPSDIEDILWDPSGSRNRLVARSKQSLGVYALKESASSATPTTTISIKPVDGTPRGAACASWNPHAEVIAAGVGSSVIGYDIRASTKSAYEITSAHPNVKCVDHNPNKPHNIATGGVDGVVRFWDTRDVTTPIKEVSDHTHWVWSVSFNRFHDQLFLSAGSDCRVNLQSIISISSAPLSDVSSDNEDDEDRGYASRDEFGGGGKPTDGLVCTSDQHEDSVYAAEWSAADPWIFASVSYDGRVAVNLVPRDHKYKIIL
ncbi:WD40-repeat-containing domain protein [Powellomyces hirtus]|nr:WD40-repeat-containing domain protein [Powellomyces hirtus]